MFWVGASQPGSPDSKKRSVTFNLKSMGQLNSHLQSTETLRKEIKREKKYWIPVGNPSVTANLITLSPLSLSGEYAHWNRGV